MLIGIISDTHGLLRPQVFEAFAGVEHILHGGDIGGLDLLSELEAIAPVTAVWGNTDGGEIRARVPEVARVRLGALRVEVVHGQQFGSPTPALVAAAHSDCDLVVFGHSHEPVIQRVGTVLAVNPGSAGARRFRTPVTVALATIDGTRIAARIVTLVG